MKIFLKSMVISLVLVFLFIFSADSLYAGWFKHYGGTGLDVGNSIQQTSDGGYIVAGETHSYSYGNADFAIYKLNSNGNKVWFKHFGGSGSDVAYSIQQTSDGGYVVAGHTDSYTYGGRDFAIYKLDSSGNKVWFKHYGGTTDDAGRCIQQTSDGGYIVAGYTSSYSYGDEDFAIYKLNSSGNKVCFRHYGLDFDSRGESIQQTSDGGYIVAGYTNSAYISNGGFDFAIYKLDSSDVANKVWFKHYGGSLDDKGYSIQQISDGGYIVAGYSSSYTHGSNDFAIYRLNSIGNKVWYKHYGGSSASDRSYSIQQTSDGGYIVAGYTGSFTHGSVDFGIYKLNSNGNKIWFKHYGGSNADRAYSIQQTSDGGYVVAGYTGSYTYGSNDIAIYKLDSSGNK